jgi:hypothetical protein
MALLAMLLFIGEIVVLAGTAIPPTTVSAPTVLAGLTAGTILFGVIKFLFMLANRPKYGAWLGLILLVVIAYGGYMKMQGEKASSAPTDTGFTA